MIEELAQIGCTIEEIAKVTGFPVEVIERDHMGTIAANWPPIERRIEMRYRRLYRGCETQELKNLLRESKSMALGVKYYPLGLPERVWSAIRSHISASAGRNGWSIQGMSKAAIEDSLGFTVHDLMLHIEKLLLAGMSWANWGEWHIDHVTPRAKFQVTGLGDPSFKKCFGLSNLQPLWAAENMAKGSK